jgi:hypothetical protein
MSGWWRRTTRVVLNSLFTNAVTVHYRATKLEFMRWNESIRRKIDMRYIRVVRKHLQKKRRWYQSR